MISGDCSLLLCLDLDAQNEKPRTTLGTPELVSMPAKIYGAQRLSPKTHTASKTLLSRFGDESQLLIATPLAVFGTCHVILTL